MSKQYIEINNESKRLSHNAITSDSNPIKKYQKVIVGSNSILYLLYFELCQFLSPIPGAIGIFLRKIFWPRLFGTCRKGTTFGRNITLRHPKRIHIGKNVVISEYCILDARNSSSNKVIELGNDGILSDNVRLTCKNGFITIGDRFGIGDSSMISSGEGDPISIGDDVLIGPKCYITGGGNYFTDRIDITIREQGHIKTGGSVLEDDIWLGANVSILGGVIFKKGCIAGTGAVVTKSFPKYSVCLGVPAKAIRNRATTVSCEIQDE